MLLCEIANPNMKRSIVIGVSNLLNDLNRTLKASIQEEDPNKGLIPSRVKRSKWLADNVKHLHLFKPLERVSYSMDRDSEMTKGNAFMAVADYFATIDPNFRSAWGEHLTLMKRAKEMAKSIKRGDFNTGSEDIPKKEKDASGGVQRNQIEQIVNDVLKDLPPKKAAEIRQMLSRSDNKLKTLQQLMK